MEKLDSYHLTAPAIAVIGAVMLLLGYTEVRLAAGNPVWS